MYASFRLTLQVLVAHALMMGFNSFIATLRKLNGRDRLFHTLKVVYISKLDLTVIGLLVRVGDSTEIHVRLTTHTSVAVLSVLVVGMVFRIALRHLVTRRLLASTIGLSINLVWLLFSHKLIVKIRFSRMKLLYLLVVITLSLKVWLLLLVHLV